MYADIGRLTANPELKTTQNGKAVCSFSIAVDDTPAPDGSKRTNFIDCVAWGKRAEHICKYFSKGSRIFITGDLKTRSYNDKNDVKHKVVEVLVDNVKFCENKPTKAAAQTSEPQYDAPDYAVDDRAFESVPDTDDLPF